MSIIVGSARHDENGKYSGGKPGDQTGREVSTQAFYVHKKGWDVLRAKSAEVANKIASAMHTACANNNIGYSMGSDRYGVVKKGVNTKEKVNCDCSSLVRACIKEATKKDVGDFSTFSEKSKILASGMFDDAGAYTDGMTLYTGDILVTKTQGHTVVVVSGNSRTEKKDDFYPKYNGTSPSIVTALNAVGEKDTSKAHRAKIAAANGISNYKYTAAQNTQMLNILKAGKLKKA